MNIYRSPLYPALMIRLPGDGRRNIKASGGLFNVASEDVEAFEALIAERPHYKIELVGTQEDIEEQHGVITDDGSQTLNVDSTKVDSVTQPEPMSISERWPELVSVESIEALNVPTIQERLRDAGLPDDGRKAVLVQRLADALGLAAASADDRTNDADATDTAE